MCVERSGKSNENTRKTKKKQMMAAITNKLSHILDRIKIAQDLLIEKSLLKEGVWKGRVNQ